MNEPMNNAISIIETVNVNAIASTIQKIGAMQVVVQKTLQKGRDYGVIPGTSKPVMLKPGSEKILMLFGLQSEFVLDEKVQNYEDGFFAFTVRCILYRDNVRITEGLGHCNSRERRYVNQDAYTIANTVLKMARKRALVDAALTVASLSDIFTQDLEDDIEGNPVEESRAQAQTPTDQSGKISTAQAKRMFALAKGDTELVRGVMKQHGYDKSEDIKKIDYDRICQQIEEGAKEARSA